MNGHTGKFVMQVQGARGMDRIAATDEQRATWARWIPGTDFHMQAQVFTEKVSCQGLFWKKK